MAGCHHEEDTILSDDTVTMTEISCADAIQEYLNMTAEDTKNLAEDAMVVDKGHNVVVHYVGRLDDENVFDTSVESVAKACGVYNEMRDYNEGLAFSVGAGQMIPGFDQGVQGMKVGETKTVTIPAVDAYGERSEDALVSVEISQVPNADQFEAGMEVVNAYGQKMKIYEVTDTHVVIDGNHELAGKDLIFDITVLEVN